MSQAGTCICPRSSLVLLRFLQQSSTRYKLPGWKMGLFSSLRQEILLASKICHPEMYRISSHQLIGRFMNRYIRYLELNIYTFFSSLFRRKTPIFYIIMIIDGYEAWSIYVCREVLPQAVFVTAWPTYFSTIRVVGRRNQANVERIIL